MHDLHEIVLDIDDEIDMMPEGSAGAARLKKLRAAIVLDVGLSLSIRYPLSVRTQRRREAADGDHGGA